MTKDELMSTLEVLLSKLRSVKGPPTASVDILEPLQECNCVYALNGSRKCKVYVCKSINK